MDYKKAGVDIEAGYKSVELMKEHVKATMRPEVIGGLGGFAGAGKIFMALHLPDNGNQMDPPAAPVPVQSRLAVFLKALILLLTDLPFLLSSRLLLLVLSTFSLLRVLSLRHNVHPSFPSFLTSLYGKPGEYARIL